MTQNRQLGDGIKLVKEDIFWPDRQWSIRRGEMIWNKTAGWKRYFDADENCRFRTAEDALTAWNARPQGD
jgi:hypothetical protein